MPCLLSWEQRTPVNGETKGCSQENYVIIINYIIRELSCAHKIITCEAEKTFFGLYYLFLNLSIFFFFYMFIESTNDKSFRISVWVLSSDPSCYTVPCNNGLRTFVVCVRLTDKTIQSCSLNRGWCGGAAMPHSKKVRASAPTQAFLCAVGMFSPVPL